MAFRFNAEQVVSTALSLGRNEFHLPDGKWTFPAGSKSKVVFDEKGEPIRQPVTAKLHNLQFTCPPGYDTIKEKVENQQRTFMCTASEANFGNLPTYKGKAIREWPASLQMEPGDTKEMCEHSNSILICYPILNKSSTSSSSSDVLNGSFSTKNNDAFQPLSCFPVPRDSSQTIRESAQKNLEDDTMAKLMNGARKVDEPSSFLQ